VRLLETALNMAGATILRIFGEKFEPQGVTMLALLAESHAVFILGPSWVTQQLICIHAALQQQLIKQQSF
jgi:hypothetical protein